MTRREAPVALTAITSAQAGNRPMASLVRLSFSCVAAASFAREHKIPFLGLCLGMQCAVISYARDVCGLENANSSEFDPSTPYPVIDLMHHQRDVVDLGASMRLGSYPAKLLQGSMTHELYGSDVVYERHRHRYEVNNKFRSQLEQSGLIISGTSPDDELVEFIELARDDHPYYVATQAHPEFKSRPDEAHPLFAGLVKAAKYRRYGDSQPVISDEEDLEIKA